MPSFLASQYLKRNEAKTKSSVAKRELGKATACSVRNKFGRAQQQVLASKAKPREKRTMKQGCRDVPLSRHNLELLVGPAEETDAQHFKRHPLADLCRWAKICPRCCYYKYKQKGTVPSYCKEKPKFMAGSWSVGCGECAAAKHCPIVQGKRDELISQYREKKEKQAVNLPIQLVVEIWLHKFHQCDAVDKRFCNARAN